MTRTLSIRLPFGPLSFASCAVALILTLPACDEKKKEADGKAGDDAPASAAKGVVDEALDEEGGEVAKFAKGMSKKGCEILTPSLVSKTYGVPEKDLKQMKIMGCIYSHNGEDEELRASITLLRAHKTVDSAKRWFKNATKDQTKKEIQKQLDTVGEKAKQREEIDTKLKKDTTDKVVDVAKMMTGDIKYEDVAKVGDEARVNTSDGNVWVRVDNLTFTVAAYQGKRQPKPAFKSMDMKDIVSASKKATEEWNKKTYEKRKADAILLAKLIVKQL